VEKWSKWTISLLYLNRDREEMDYIYLRMRPNPRLEPSHIAQNPADYVSRGAPAAEYSTNHHFRQRAVFSSQFIRELT
jgi:hypothetical protein